MVHAAGGDVTRRHRVDPHAAVRPFGRCRLGETDHAGPRRAAVTHGGHGAPDVGDDVDDAAAVPGHGLQVTLARHQKPARQVGVDDRLPALGADAFQRRYVLATGVVDQAVDAAMRQHNGRHRGLYPGLLPDVTGVKAGAATGCNNLARHIVQLLELAPDQHHMRAKRRQLVGVAAAYAGAPTCHHHHLAGKKSRAENRPVAHGRALLVGGFGLSPMNRAMAASASSSSDAPFLASNH